LSGAYDAFVMDVAMAPELPVGPPPAKVSRFWRVVLMVAAFHVLIGLIGFVFFSTMAAANAGLGGCGGG
jgi:hypothetical protein